MGLEKRNTDAKDQASAHKKDSRPTRTC